MKLPKFPCELRRGSSSVKIYFSQKRGRTEFKVSYYSDDKRCLEQFGDFEKAKTRADAILEDLNRGRIANVKLTGDEIAILRRVDQRLRPIGVTLEFAVDQFITSREILGDTPPVIAAQYYRQQHPVGMKNVTVDEAVKECIADKEKRGRSKRYLEDLRHRLGDLKRHFSCDISRVTASQLVSYMDSLKRDVGKSSLSPASMNNFRYAIITFFRWAKDQNYLPKDWDETKKIGQFKEAPTPISIYTPDELKEMLKVMPPRMVPFLVIGAFAGLRSSEICKLAWAQIGKGAEKYIEVTAENASKTSQRRLVPISKNLAAWLEPHRKEDGKVWENTGAHYYDLIRQLRWKDAEGKDLPLKWKPNALRHSRISYRLAEIQDAAKVALESGNSPQMIFQHYRELVTPEQAKEWFSIMPPP